MSNSLFQEASRMAPLSVPALEFKNHALFGICSIPFNIQPLWSRSKWIQLCIMAVSEIKLHKMILYSFIILLNIVGVGKMSVTQLTCHRYSFKAISDQSKEEY